MDGAGLSRAVQNAIPGLVASLGGWGVTGAHQLPASDGFPVLWLTTATDDQRDLVACQGWLPAQVHMLLLRGGVQPESVARVRVMFDSQEALARLLDG